MVDLGFQDTDWVSGNDNEVLNMILRRDSLILCTLNMDKVECGYLRCISGWFGATREPLGSQMVDSGCQNTDWVGRNDNGFRCNFAAGWPHTSHFEHEQRKMWLCWVGFWLV